MRRLARFALASLLLVLPATAHASEPDATATSAAPSGSAATIATVTATTATTASAATTTTSTAGSTATPATTATTPPAKEQPEQQKGVDYTLPLMVTDLALMGAFAASWTLGKADAISPGAAFGGVTAAYGGFILSGVLYHEAFDVRRKTGLSVAVRTLAPFVFGGLSAAYARNAEDLACAEKNIPAAQCNHEGAAAAAFVGALIGMLGATVAEATILIPDGRKPLPTVRRSGISFTPTAGPARGGGQIGLAAVF